MIDRRILGLILAVAAVTLTAASTAYACVVLKGDATVTGAVKNTNLMTGLGSGHDYCPGRSPITAAAGGVGTNVGLTVAPATACNAGGGNQLSAGNYDVRLRNTRAGYTGGDGTGWVQVAGSGCFVPGNAGDSNRDLGDLAVPASGSAVGTWTIPLKTLAGNTLESNTPADASVFCVGKFGADGAAPTGISDGFLAPFRVTTV